MMDAMPAPAKKTLISVALAFSASRCRSPCSKVGPRVRDSGLQKHILIPLAACGGQCARSLAPGDGRSDKDCHVAREVKVLFFADTGSIQHSITYHTPRGICTKQRVSDLVGRLARPSFGLQRSDFGFQTVCLKGQILIFKAGVRTAGRPVAVRRASRGFEPAGSRHEAKQA